MTLDLPVNHGDDGTWGAKLNAALTDLDGRLSAADGTYESQVSAARRVPRRTWLAASGLMPRPALIDPEEWRGDRAKAGLTIPTYDGSGQGVHPDVFHAPEGWGSDSNGKAWKWWMAFEPYPASNNSFENPSILVSDDGVAWSVPPGLTNPVAPKPSNGYSSDGELTLVGGVLYLTYRNVIGNTEVICWRSSTNGITWTAETAMLTVTKTGNNGIVSPTIAYDEPSQKWCMWSGLDVAGTPVVERRTATDITGPWSAPVTCSFTLPYPGVGTTHTLWHLDVISYGGQYLMLAATQTDVGQYFLYFGTSYDGVSWSFGSRPVIPRGGGSRWDANPYRGCLVPVQAAGGAGLRVYYSAASAAGWAIGVTEIRPWRPAVDRSSTFLPEDHGYLGWTFDPIYGVGTSNALTAGAVAYVLVRVAAGGYIDQLNAQVTTAGVLTAGQNFFAIYDIAGNKLAETADVSAALSSTGGKGFTFTAPTRYVRAGELLMVAYLYNGTTVPRFAAQANPVAAAFGRAASPATSFSYPPRGGRFGTGLTALPATVGTVVGDVWIPWFGLVPAAAL